MMKNIVLILCLTLITLAFTACNGGKTGNANSPANKPSQAATKVPPTAPLGATPAWTKGSPTATVTIEEFADYQCGTCAATHPKMNEILSKYGNKINFIYRNFPLKIPSHDKAYEASVAAEAAGIQGKFWEMQALLFNNQSTWSKSTDFKKNLEDYAKQLNLNYDQFTTDMAGLAAKSRVDADIKRADAIGIKSTPTIILNGRIIAFEEHERLSSLIDAELAKGGNSSAQSATANANSTNSNTANANK